MSTAEQLIQVGLLGEAVDLGPALVFVADETMRYVAVNRLAAETLGYERHELLGLNVTDIARYEDAPEEYADMLARGRQEGVAILTHRDGHEIRMRYRASETVAAHLGLYVSVGFVED
ncbi:MAG: PAS domain-containing protein [Gaiellaceae bacterium]